MWARSGAMPAPPPIYIISRCVGLMWNSPYGPEIVTLSPGLRPKIYDEQIPGLTSIHLLWTRSHGGVATRMLSMMILPSAGWLAIEYARKIGSSFFIFRSH